VTILPGRFILHNAVMPCCKVRHRAAAAFLPLSLSLSLFFCLPFLFFGPSAKRKPSPIPDADYVAALAVADHFLQAWQSGDTEKGIVLLSSHARAAATADVVEKFFSNPETSGFEINHGKLLKRGRYEFPIVLISATASPVHLRRRFSTIVIVNTGNNDWAVDNLP